MYVIFQRQLARIGRPGHDEVAWRDDALVVTTIELPTAPLGPCSPLPMLDPPVEPSSTSPTTCPTTSPNVLGAGAPPSLLPYLAQDDYGRELTPRPHRVAVLENDLLRATVALDLGGRLLSLYDRRADRQLLYVQPGRPAGQPRTAQRLVLRGCRVEHRHAWSLTDDDGHAARGASSRDLMEIRCCGCGSGSGSAVSSSRSICGCRHRRAVLLARTRIRNVNDMATPMYWWTNAAITVSADTRVIAPATRAFRTEYPSGLRVTGVPDDGDGDVTFPARQATGRRLLLRRRRPAAPVDRRRRRRRGGNRPRLDRCTTWPQVVRLGHRPRRTSVAAVAVPRWRRGVRRDPGEAWRPPSSST